MYMRNLPNPKNKIFQWGPIDGLPIYPDYWGRGCLKFNKDFKPGWPVFLLYINEEKFYCLLDYKKLYANGEEVFKRYILNDKEFKRNYKKWEDMICEFKRIYRIITSDRLRKMKEAEFKNLFFRWNKFYGTKFWNIGTLAEVANWGGEQILSRELRKYLSDEKDFSSVFEKLSAPEDFSFYQREEIELLKIKEIKDEKAQEVKLRKHQQKYFWLLNSYHHTQILGIDYFKKILSEYSPEVAKLKYNEIKNSNKNIVAEKDEIIKKFNHYIPHELALGYPCKEEFEKPLVSQVKKIFLIDTSWACPEVIHSAGKNFKNKRAFKFRRLVAGLKKIIYFPGKSYY